MESARPHRVACEPGHHASGTDQYLLGGVLTVLLEHKYASQLHQLCEELSSCSVCNNSIYKIYIYIYLGCTIALNSHMHAHIYGSVHDYRYAPTSMTTFIHNLTKLKFAGTEKKWPNLRGRAVEVRALTQPICNLWAAKTNHSDKNDVLIKMLLERSCEYDQVVIDHPDVPRLDDQAPRLIYIHMFFLFRYSAFVIFVFFICMCICTVGQFEVARRLQSVATEFIALYKAAKTAWGLLGDYFCITKKFHDLFHLAHRADEINPALTSCKSRN